MRYNWYFGTGDLVAPAFNLLVYTNSVNCMRKQTLAWLYWDLTEFSIKNM